MIDLTAKAKLNVDRRRAKRKELMEKGLTSEQACLIVNQEELDRSIAASKALFAQMNQNMDI